MKAVVALLSVLCVASASFYDAVDQESIDLVSDFWSGMDKAPSLASLEPEFAEEAKQVEEEVKSQLAWSLREALAKVLQHIRETFQKAEEGAKHLMIKAAELIEKLKSFAGAGEGLRDRLREKIRDWVKVFLKTLNGSDQEYSLIRVPLELDEKNLIENLKQNILERLNLKDVVEYVKEKLQKLGEIGRVLLEALQRPGAIEKLKGLLEVLLPSIRHEYSIQDVWAKVRDFFKNLGVKISDKFFAFANWVKGVAHKGWEQVKDKAGKLKELAKTVTEKAKTMSKQAAEQALQFFNEHKAEIGQLAWTAVKAALTAAITSAG